MLNVVWCRCCCSDGKGKSSTRLGPNFGLESRDCYRLMFPSGLRKRRGLYFVPPRPIFTLRCARADARSSTWARLSKDGSWESG
jgi:hypothetical protein